jgi:YbgC/YbaW family acyl-CoA thioester hydrolase
MEASPSSLMGPAPAAEQPRIRIDVQVMFFDTDCAAVVHNLAYLRFIETARTLLAEKLGMSLAQMAKSQLFPVVARTEIDYRKPAALGDVLAVEGWLESLNRTRFWCGFHIRRKSDGQLMVECRQMLALVQMPAGRPVRLPAEWQTLYAPWVKDLKADSANGVSA